ncbi:hypothetical protein TNCV_2060861 [Trichonephila clavipes]|nr:hypothetical protein TNCV_2060861 [Trichonephila clavipes]
MSESDSDDESWKSIRPGSAMSTISDSSTGLQTSDCMKRRKAIRAMEKLEFELTTHMKSLVYSQAKGDMASIPKIEKNIKTNQEEKERKVSELRTLPPCLDANCPDHTVLSQINPVPNSSKTKIQSQKRKNEKEDSEGFAFPKKTARPITPTKALEPLQTQNNFETLTQDPEPVINMTNKLIPTARDLFGNQSWIFQDDNAPCPRAKVVQKWLKDHTVNRMNWTGQSPDLNPKENLWFEIGYEISKKKPSNKHVN